MGLKVIIKSYHKTIPELRDMLIDYNLDGGTILRGVNDDRILPFDASGELSFEQSEYDSLNQIPDIRFEGGMFYMLQPASWIDNLVDVDFPDAKYIDENGDEQRRVYQEYFPWHWELDDGQYLVLVRHSPTYNVEYGEGLSDENRKIFQTAFGTLLVRSAGEAYKPVVEEDV